MTGDYAECECEKCGKETDDIVYVQSHQDANRNGGYHYLCQDCFDKERQLKALDRIADELAYANDLKYIELVRIQSGGYTTIDLSKVKETYRRTQ